MHAMSNSPINSSSHEIRVVQTCSERTMDGANPTRQSTRNRFPTQKAFEWSAWDNGTYGTVLSDSEDTPGVIEKATVVPQAKRTEIDAHSKEHVVATKVKALAAKAGERPATMTVNAQMRLLTDLVKSLLSTMEEQKEKHANQLETLRRH